MILYTLCDWQQASRRIIQRLWHSLFVQCEGRQHLLLIGLMIHGRVIGKN